VKTTDEEKFLHEFNDQWRSLWRDLVRDRVHAEKVADKDYTLLFLERGTVVKTTAEINSLSYREILQQHNLKGKRRFPPPDPQVGGWGKFSRTSITTQKKLPSQKEVQPKPTSKQPQRSKKGGRGWLHMAL
jgi:hypothetical protein